MSRALIIAKRELSSYFYSPVAYVAMTLFLFASGIFFRDDFNPGQPVEMRHTFDSMLWLLLVIIPMLGMGLLAQEWAVGTIETMMTAPVNETEVVFGKFLGSLGFFVVLLIPTIFYVLLLRLYGQPDYGPILSGYLGMILVAGLFISITLMFSAMTAIQVVAAALAFTLLCVLTVLPWAATKVSVSPFFRNALDQLVFTRYTAFTDGSIDTGNLIFFIATTGVFLFITVKVLEWNRWK
jgi:ABC-2 type transport system permease protein